MSYFYLDTSTVVKRYVQRSEEYTSGIQGNTASSGKRDHGSGVIPHTEEQLYKLLES